MSETSPGVYTATVPPFTSAGMATVTIRAECPDGSIETSSFSIYIDPSGRVIDWTCAMPSVSKPGRAVSKTTDPLSQPVPARECPLKSRYMTRDAPGRLCNAKG